MSDVDGPGRKADAGPTDSAPGPTDSAPRRTYLAAERTYLAWLRTGLGALGLGLAVGRLIPALMESEHTEFGLLGAGYALLGVFLIVFAAWRQRRIARALTEGEPLPLDGWVVTVLTVSGLVLAVATFALVLAEV
jgi:putative membrane protein